VLWVNRADGSTARLTLGPLPLTLDPGLRGASLGNGEQRVAVQAPRRFGRVAYSAEADDAGAERLDVQAGEVLLTVIRYASGMVRVGLVRTGHPRYLPALDGRPL